MLVHPAPSPEVHQHWLVNATTTNLATRVEALLACLETELRIDGHPTRRLLTFIRAGLARCLERQVHSGDPMAHGGFTQRRRQAGIRIDYVHHPLGAALTLLRIERELVRASGLQPTALSSPRSNSWHVDNPQHRTRSASEGALSWNELLELAKSVESSGISASIEQGSTPESGSGMTWLPQSQRLFHEGRSYVHLGPTVTDPSHDLAHLIVASASSLPWLPSGTAGEVKIAEYNAVFLEHLLCHVFNCSSQGRREPLPVAESAREYARWFVEHHYAPFPLSYDEAEQRFRAGLDLEATVRLSPLFFEQKRRERQCDFRQRRWEMRFRASDSPETDTDGRRFQQLARESLCGFLAEPHTKRHRTEVSTREEKLS
jgi:hypothetical protein